MRRILSIDGGGIRGAMVASFIKSIEEVTRKSFVDHFDLIAGTSTGGIIAMGLGAGFSGAELLELYKSLGPSVFSRSTFLGKLGLRSKFNAEPLRKALEEKFSDLRIGNSKTRLLIPAYDNFNSRLHVFKTAHHERLQIDFNEKMVDVALATGSAPSFFPNYEIEAGRFLIDGGVWANNPSIYAAVEARSLLAWKDEVRMLSISCGSGPVKFLKNPGKLRVLVSLFPSVQSPIVELLMRAQSEASSGGAAHLLNHSTDEPRFFRIEPRSIGHISLDSTDQIDVLIEAGRALAEKHLNVVREEFLLAPVAPFEPIHRLSEIPIDPDRSARESNIVPLS